MCSNIFNYYVETQEFKLVYTPKIKIKINKWFGIRLLLPYTIVSWKTSKVLNWERKCLRFQLAYTAPLNQSYFALDSLRLQRRWRRRKLLWRNHHHLKFIWFSVLILNEMFHFRIRFDNSIFVHAHVLKNTKRICKTCKNHSTLNT